MTPLCSSAQDGKSAKDRFTQPSEKPECFRKKRRCFSALSCVLSLLCLAMFLVLPGCKKGNGVRVQGTAAVKGEPIMKGMIQFVAVDGNTAEAGGVIQDGKFDVTVLPGEKIVRIRGSRVTGKRKVEPTPGNIVEVDIEVSLTSQKEHWDQSQLRENITTKTNKLEYNL